MNNRVRPQMQSELFMILAIAFFLVAIQAISKSKTQKEELENLAISPKQYEDSLKLLTQAIIDLENQINSKSYAPIFFLSEENKNFRFESGSYDLDQEYQRALESKILEIDSIANKYPQFNAIEIIGHTDGRPISQRLRNENNTDKGILNLLNSLYPNYDNDSTVVIPGSNVDLGLLRAMSVAIFMRNNSTDKKLNNIIYWLPVSSGPLIQENGLLLLPLHAKADARNDTQSRRRIEIRLFKYVPLETSFRN